MHLKSGALDLDRLEASLSSKTNVANANKTRTLKWLKDTSSAVAAPKLSVAEEQRAQISAAASGGGGGGGGAPSSSGSAGGVSSSGAGGPVSGPGAPDFYSSVHVKAPVLKTLRNVSGGTDKSSLNLLGAKDRPVMIEVILNDRLGKKVRVKCNSNDTVGDLKKLAAAQLGTKSDKLRIQKWYTVYKDHVRLDDYEIHDGMGLELYYM